MLQAGGCIVGLKGNIFIDFKKMSSMNYIRDIRKVKKEINLFSNALCEYLISKGLNTVRCDNNDILVDNFKVASGCYNIFQKNNDCIQYTGYQISLYQDLDLINHICNKEMIKIPKALAEYGITTEEIVQFIKNYFKVK